MVHETILKTAMARSNLRRTKGRRTGRVMKPAIDYSVFERIADFERFAIASVFPPCRVLYCRTGHSKT